MSFEEEFDSIMRQKADGADFPFDEKHWEAASRMLDNRNAAARRGIIMKWFLPSAILLVSGISIVLLLNGEGESANTKKLAMNIPVQSTQAETVNTDGNVIMRQPESLADRKPVKNDLDGPSVASPEQDMQPAQVQKVNAAKLSPPPSEQREMNTPASHAPVEAVGVKATDTVPGAVTKAESNTKSNDKLSEAENTKAAGNVPSQDVLPQNNTNPVPDAIVMNNNQSQEPVDVVEKESETAPVKEPYVQEGSAGNAAAVSYLAPYSLMLPGNESPEILVLPIQEIRRQQPDYIRNYKQFFGLEGGAAYAKGWLVKGIGEDGKGLNWYGGLYYDYQVQPKHSVETGLQFFSFSHIQSYYYSSEGKSYGFGYTSSISTVTAEQLYYLNLPFKYFYHLNKQFKVGLGLNASYAVTGRSRVDKYSVSDGVKGPVNASYGKLFEGVTPFVFAGSAVVSSRISERLSVQAELFYGFSDMFKNYNSVDRFENNTSLRVGLKYTLYNK